MRISSIAPLFLLASLLVGCSGDDGETPRPDAARATDAAVTPDAARADGPVDAAAPSPDTRDAAATDAAPVDSARDGLPAVDTAAPDSAPDVMRRACPKQDGGARDAGAGASPDGGARGAVLFIVNKRVTVPGDDILQARLEARGFTVTAMQDADATTMDATGKVLVLISSSSSGTAVGTKWKDVAVPVMIMEPFVLDDLLLTSAVATDVGFAELQTEIFVSNPGHPLAAGLGCYVTISNAPGQVAWGVPGTSAEVAATIADDEKKAAIFGYRTGAMLVGGTPAPARRLAWFASENLAPSLNEAGFALFDAGVDWALGR